jgi:hypothetical protein
MLEHRQYEDDSGRRLNDPEPISICIALFSATVAAAGLIRQYKQQQKEDARRRRRYVREVGKRLTELCDSYRDLVDIYAEQGILNGALAPGSARIEGDEELIARIDSLRNNVFVSGQKLEKALDALSEYIDDSASKLAQEYSEQLLVTYKQGMKAGNDLRHSMASLGELLAHISDFHNRLSGLYRADLVAIEGRSERIKVIVANLREGMADPAGSLTT